MLCSLRASLDPIQHGVLRQSRGVFFETAEIFGRRSSKDLNPVHGCPWWMASIEAPPIPVCHVSINLQCLKFKTRFKAIPGWFPFQILFNGILICLLLVYCFSNWYTSPSKLINAGYSPRRIVSWGRVVYKQSRGIHHPLSLRNSSGRWRPHAPLEVMPSLKTAEESRQQMAGSQKSRVVRVVDEISLPGIAPDCVLTFAACFRASAAERPNASKVESVSRSGSAWRHAWWYCCWPKLCTIW